MPERRRFLKFLEGVAAGTLDLDAALAEKGPPEPSTAELRIEWGEAATSRATLLRVRGPDSLGILYRLTRGISSAGCDIELAHIETPEGEVRDEFRLTLEGGAVPPQKRREVEAAVESSLGSRVRWRD